MSETACKHLLRDICGCWSEAYETRSGSGLGYPDLQLLVAGVLLPVEVKLGWVKGGRLYSSRIRPSQITWHHEFLQAGGAAFIVVFDEQRNAWSVPSGHRDVTSQWREGWDLCLCMPWVKSGVFVFDLVAAVAGIVGRNF